MLAPPIIAAGSCAGDPQIARHEQGRRQRQKPRRCSARHSCFSAFLGAITNR